MTEGHEQPELGQELVQGQGCEEPAVLRNIAHGGQNTLGDDKERGSGHTRGGG